jgi:hypothetical protein
MMVIKKIIITVATYKDRNNLPEIIWPKLL